MGSEVPRLVAEALRSGEITDRESLLRLKMKLCSKYGAEKVPPNSEVLALLTPEEREKYLPLLVKKPVRTASGVSAVAVMTSPYPCPHGRCIYCPGGPTVNSPQSYTGKEPAARRAAANHFDPYDQVVARITQLEDVGHTAGKIDLIIMGGNFTSRDPMYQEWFLKRCFDAMNGVPSDSLEDAEEINSRSEHRCVGMTIETRPDYFMKDGQIERAMRMGFTRVELGVQILDDEILKGVKRGHGTAEVRRATEVCRRHGLLVCYHLMPGLPGSSPEHDLECFRKVFSDPAYRPDSLKFYPALVIEGTELWDMWKAGEYEPLTTEQAIDLLSQMKSEVPEYVRIQRIQRDIPVPEIAAGIMKSNLRQIVQENMKEKGMKCRCIRCREVGRSGVLPENPEEVELKTQTYEASGGMEHFISFEYRDSLVGYIRLRIDDSDIATIRELKVSGQETAVGKEAESWQHRGYGKKLLAEAERQAGEAGKTRMRVTVAPGAREYYAKLGYSFEAPYMAKEL